MKLLSGKFRGLSRKKTFSESCCIVGVVSNAHREHGDEDSFFIFDGSISDICTKLFVFVCLLLHKNDFNLAIVFLFDCFLGA